LTELTQVWATVAGCSCCEVTSRFSLEISAVVSFASMALRRENAERTNTFCSPYRIVLNHGDTVG